MVPGWRRTKTGSQNEFVERRMKGNRDCKNPDSQRRTRENHEKKSLLPPRNEIINLGGRL
jgi:hypothetical protein